MKWMLLCLCAGCTEGGTLAPAESSWPAGSKIGTVCFEHETDGGWEPAIVRRLDGGLAVKGSSVSGEWYFQTDAGALRLRNCW